MTPDLEPLVAAVRTNCHISDARHARDLTLCTYLLEMREMYRWERGIPFGAALVHEDVRRWIAERELMWSTFEEAAEVALPFPSGTVEAYDAKAANRELRTFDMVYGAGIGPFGKPQFFLAELEREEWREGMRILVAGRERVRDLSAAPAASRDGTIYVRLEALRRLLWERFEAHRGNGALAAALALHGFDGKSDETLSGMVASEAEALILHEIGECRAGERVGPQWEAVLGGLASRHNELFMRAVRDHVADCTITLPRLLDRDAVASVHFWFANLSGMRKSLFPAVEPAYARWRACGSDEPLRAAACAGALHWPRIAEEILLAYAQGGEDAIAALAKDPATVL
ncbi:MAG: hypothetical protein U1F54_13820 [Burkholderiales bacterium]